MLRVKFEIDRSRHSFSTVGDSPESVDTTLFPDLNPVRLHVMQQSKIKRIFIKTINTFGIFLFLSLSSNSMYDNYKKNKISRLQRRAISLKLMKLQHFPGRGNPRSPVKFATTESVESGLWERAESPGSTKLSKKKIIIIIPMWTAHGWS